MSETPRLPEQTSRFALVAITKHGVSLVERLNEGLPESDIYFPAKFFTPRWEGRALVFEGSVKQILPLLFGQYEGIVMAVSLGAVVRMIAPLLKDKKTDPAVVVVDDNANFAVSVLSGHLGGANELTRRVAGVLGAQPVITTASDVRQTIPVDLLGQRFGWHLEYSEKVTPVSASVVNEERVAIIQESGEPGWWPYETPLPEHFRLYASASEAIEQYDSFDAALVITHRLLDEKEQILLDKGVIYRPKSVVVGIGCNRGTSADEIEAAVLSALAANRISEKSIRSLASIDLKRDEEGLLEAAERLGVPIRFYSAEELNEIQFPNRSEVVFRYTGAYGVSEPAAIKGAGGGPLLVEKVTSGNVTLAVALVDFTEKGEAVGK